VAEITNFLTEHDKTALGAHFRKSVKAGVSDGRRSANTSRSGCIVRDHHNLRSNLGGRFLLVRRRVGSWPNFDGHREAD
jgi:hypothetical protein